MDLRDLILEMVKLHRSVRVADVVSRTGFSRAYVHRHLQQLCRDGQLMLLGKANRARYVPVSQNTALQAKRNILEINRILLNRNLSEDVVLGEIKTGSGIYFRLPPNVARILDYAFTEMLNNAIEHSRSQKIRVWLRRSREGVAFKVVDHGIGVFKNIQQTRRLASELEAIQELIKGKQTTDPSRHSGEGIFFTSKVADRLMIKGSSKKITYDNRIPDVFIHDVKPIVGTHVEFMVDGRSRKRLKDVFAEYSGNAYEFARTVVTVKLFKTEGDYVSRSQARRLLTGLERFKTIVLDFKDVSAIGQAFADEVFRVWSRNHAGIEFEIRNANEAVRMMMSHVRGF